MFSRLLAGALVAAIVDVAMAQTPTCSIEGFAFASEPVYAAWARGAGPEFHDGIGRCAVVGSHDFTSGGATYRATVAELFGRRDGPPILAPRSPLRLLSFFRVEGGRDILVGRALLDRDPFDGQARFEPQTAEVEGRLLFRAMRRAPSLYIVAHDSVTPTPAFGWRTAAAERIVPTDTLGQGWSVDLATMQGYVAVHDARADDPAQPGSALRPGRVLKADLVWRGDALALADARFVERGDRPGMADVVLREIEDQDAAVADRAPDIRLPAGAEACVMTGWSKADGAGGLAIRATPAPDGRVLGVAPPPRRAGGQTHRAGFDILGYLDGWFMVARTRWAEDAPRGGARPYAGRGWVEARSVGVALAASGLPPDRVYASPHGDAAWRPATRRGGEPQNHGDAAARILACSGWWGLVETTGGQRGWVRALCASQHETCD